MSLAGRVAVVTGGAGDIGRSVASDLVSRGMAVAVSDCDPAAGSVAESLMRASGRAIGVVCDVTRGVEVEAMMERVERELGPVWLLVNCAGVLSAAPTAEMSEEEWDRTLGVDAKGVFLCSRAAIRRMIPRRAGRIVNVSSIAGRIPRIGQVAYCSAKAAVNHFTRCLAVEMAPYGITVNAVLPGTTKTAMTVESFRQRGFDVDGMASVIPAGRLALPDDHAAMIAFFASEEAGFVTGQLVSVDGGQSDFMPLLAAGSRP